jgi:hypothetical protein
MSEADHPPERRHLSPEEFGRLLKETVHRRRPLSLRAVFFWLALLALALGLFLWWMRPRPLPPRLTVWTFEQITAAGKSVVLRGQLRADVPDADLAGQELFFEDVTVPRPRAGKPWKAQGVTRPDGVASVSWQAPAEAGVMEFAVRFSGDLRRRGSEDRARVFVVPAGTPLLLVEVETALTGARAEAWAKRSIFDIPRLDEPAKALEAVQAGKQRIVYLGLQADQPLIYHKVRDWVQRRPTGKERPLPAGPVLGRPDYDAVVEQGRALRLVVGDLRDRMGGPLAAVTGQAAEAEAMRDAGLRTFLITKGSAPAGVIPVPTWSDLPARLRAP